MEHAQNDIKEAFFEMVLMAYFDNNQSLKNVLNISLLDRVVNEFTDYFSSQDLMHKTNHSFIIKQIFVTKELNRQNCVDFGYNIRTFYRYRKLYLQIFEMFLMEEIE